SGEGEDCAGLHPLERTMIFTIAITGRADGRAVMLDDARALYKDLYTDLSERYPEPARRAVASLCCHVGQPVKCRRLADGDWQGTLRLSLGAPRISEMAHLSDEEIHARLAADLGSVFAKLHLLLEE